MRLRLSEQHCAPKALFPFYVPNHPGQLGVFPLSGDAIFLP